MIMNKDRADKIITHILTYHMFPKDKVSSEELHKMFSQQDDISLENFRRQLATIRDEFNKAQFYKYKSGLVFNIMITTSQGYGSISSMDLISDEEAKKAFRDGRDFYYSRVKEVVDNTKRLDEILMYTNSNQETLF